MSVIKILRRFYVTKPHNFKVCITDAAGGIGQPLALLLKQHPFITELVLLGPTHVHGIATDLSHIESSTKVTSFQGTSCDKKALRDCHLVIHLASVPLKAGMTGDDLFKGNAPIVQSMAMACTEVCPKAFVAIVSSSIDSLVPLWAGVYKKAGMFNPRRLFGVTTINVVRVNTFVAELKNLDPTMVNIPVIGGQTDATIIPVLSQSRNRFDFTENELENLIDRIKTAEQQVFKLKAGKGSATLSIAYATARFVNSLIRGLRDEKCVVECAYVRSDVTDAKYFANPLILGKCGMDTNLGHGLLNQFERAMLNNAMPKLKNNIKRGEDFLKCNEDSGAL